MYVTTERPDHRSGFETFFRESHPKLVALGLAWSGDRQTALDVAQEALARAYGAWNRIADLDAPGAWVRRVAINLLIDQRRDQQRRLRLVSQMATDEVHVDETSADGAWWQAVRALPERERAAVTLHYIEDLSVGEVAAILEIAPGTVKATLAHARQKLRATLTGGTQ